MKKLTTFLIAAFCVMSVFGQSSKQVDAPKKLCVFVVGLRTDMSNYFTNLLTNSFWRNYTIIPRTDVVKNKIKELQEYENAGNVDDRELTEWGRQNGVQVICIVSATYFDDYMFSAQLIDVKSNTQLSIAEYAIPSLNSEDLKKAASALAVQMQRKN